MSLIVFYFVITILVSFTCSMLESILLSTSPAFIQVKLKSNKTSGKLLDRFRKQIDRPISAILTLNTIANTAGATAVGTQAVKVLGDTYLATITVILTLTVLVFGEIIPKTIGATYWKRLAGPAAYLIQVLIYITYPIVRLSEFIHNIWGIQRKHTVSREEMIVTAEMGAQEGTIREKEGLIIKNLLKLDQIQVHEIMTPRSVVKAYDMKDTVAKLVGSNKTIRFSRLPVYDKNFDHVVGLLFRYKLMEAASQDLDNLTLEELMAPIHTVPESISVSAAIDQFIKRKEHLFLVVDEYGVPSGIVTLEDAIETLLGVEIVDETDSVVDMRKHALEEWQRKKSEFKPIPGK